MGELLPFKRRTAQTTEPWVRQHGIADHFSVHQRTIRRWTAEGMPSRKLGGIRLYRISACEQWVESQPAG